LSIDLKAILYNKILIYSHSGSLSPNYSLDFKYLYN